MRNSHSKDDKRKDVADWLECIVVADWLLLNVLLMLIGCCNVVGC